MRNSLLKKQDTEQTLRSTASQTPLKTQIPIQDIPIPSTQKPACQKDIILQLDQGQVITKIKQFILQKINLRYDMGYRQTADKCIKTCVQNLQNLMKKFSKEQIRKMNKNSLRIILNQYFNIIDYQKKNLIDKWSFQYVKKVHYVRYGPQQEVSQDLLYPQCKHKVLIQKDHFIQKLQYVNKPCLKQKQVSIALQQLQRQKQIFFHKDKVLEASIISDYNFDIKLQCQQNYTEEQEQYLKNYLLTKGWLTLLIDPRQ